MDVPTSLRYRFLKEAEVELLEAGQWYRDRDDRIHLRFEAAIASAIDLIINFPESGVPHLHGTRRRLLDDFPYGIVYRRTGAWIEIIAIAHAKRRPGYWRNRP